MLSGTAALGCGVPLNLLCNLWGITDFSPPVRQDLKPLFKLKKQMNKTACSAILQFFSWLDLTLFEGSKQAFRTMATLYKNRVGKKCLRFSQLETAFPSLWSK